MADTEGQTLQALPLLPSDYPLFDWEDWPDSRAALVQGGKTRKFEKECWNAIMDALTGGIEAAGLELYRAEEGLTPNHLKMLTGTYGRMTAALFNTVLLCIDDITPFKWRWDVDRSFRGFVNRWYFIKSYREYGKKADIFYPEYILELVRRINLLLEILRGTAPTLDVAAQGRGRSIVSPGLRADPSVPIIWSRNIRTLVNPAAIRAGIGLPIAVPLGKPSASLSSAQLLPGKAALINEYVHISQRIKAEGAVRRSASMQASSLVGSSAYAALDLYNSVEYRAELLAATALTAGLEQGAAAAAEARQISRALHTAGMDMLPHVALSGRMLFASWSAAQLRQALPAAVSTSGLYSSKTKAAAEALICTQTEKAHCKTSTTTALEAHGGQGAHVAASFLTGSKTGAEANTGAAIHAEGRQRSATGADISIIKGKIRPGWAEQKSGAAVAASVEALTSGALDLKQKSSLTVVCSLGTAWEPPIWHDGGLWIRQARTIKIKPDGSMDLSGTGDPIAAVQKSATTIAIALDTAWLPPVWQDGGLYIRQVREVKVSEDGSLDLSGAGDELGAAVRIETKIACALDTAWYAPVWVNGGLYLQQSQSVTQYENGELEVQ